VATTVTGVADFMKQFNLSGSTYKLGIVPDQPLNDKNLLLYPSIGGATTDGQYSPAGPPYQLADPSDHDLTDPVMIRIVVATSKMDWVQVPSGSSFVSVYKKVASHSIVKFVLKKG
jgi:hypothetical protein